MNCDFVVCMGESFDRRTHIFRGLYMRPQLVHGHPSVTELPVFLPSGIMVNNG